jgi:hypothetical protein
LNFSRNQINSSIKVSWSTSSEINNDHLIPEKSFDGLSYEDHIRNDVDGIYFLFLGHEKEIIN